MEEKKKKKKKKERKKEREICTFLVETLVLFSMNLEAKY